MKLRDLQERFKEFILDRSPLTFGASHPEGLNIYKQNYFASLAFSVKNKYPRTTALLEVAVLKAFIMEHQSDSANLDDYGDEFPDFLRMENLGDLAEIAALELIIFKSGACAKEDPLLASDIAMVMPEEFDRLYLSLNRSVNLIKLSKEAHRLWIRSTCAQDENTDSRAVQSQQNTLFLVSFLKEFLSTVIAIKEGEYEFLYSIKSGHNLLKSIEQAISVDAEFDFRRCLNLCFSNHLFQREFRIDSH